MSRMSRGTGALNADFVTSPEVASAAITATEAVRIRTRVTGHMEKYLRK
jgi:hypothetical protein